MSKFAIHFSALCLTLSIAAFAGDGLEQVPPTQVDLSKDTMQMTPAVDSAFREFDARDPKVGSLAPDFTLKTVSGRIVHLADLRGKKPALIVFGSASCDVFRRHAMPLVEKLKGALADSGVADKIEVFELYTIEAHPAAEASPYVGGQWTRAENVEDKVLVHQPKDEAARHANATALVTRYKLDADHMLVDGIDNAVWKTYGGLPNDLYLVDKDGRIAFKERWAFTTPDVTRTHPAFLDALEKVLAQ